MHNMSIVSRLRARAAPLPALLLMLLLGLPAPAALARVDAAANAPAPTPTQTLRQLDTQLDGVKAALQAAPKHPLDKAALADLRTQALQVQDAARQLATDLAPQMAALDAQLAVLGPPPASGGAPETAAVAAQRRQLNHQQADLNAQIVRAKSLNLDALQVVAQITGLRNDQFQEQLATRTNTPLASAFWHDQRQALPNDLARLQRLGGRWSDAWQAAWQPPNRRPLILCLVAAVLLLLGGRWTLAQVWHRVVLRVLPDGHLRRSATVLAMALITTLVLGLVAQLVHQAVNWGDALDDDLDAMARSAVHAISFAALMAGLGSAMLAARHPSWRLLPLADDVARRLHRYPWYLGGAAFLVGITERIVRSIGSSLPATVLLHALLALLVSALIGSVLLRVRHARRQREAQGGNEVRRSLWVGAASAAAALGVVTCWLAVFTGFIALAFFIAVQMLWTGLIAASLYLLTELARDAFDALLSPHGRSGQRLQAGFDLDPQALTRTALVLTGIARVLLALAALALVLAPFDANPGELVQRTLQRFSGLKLGQLTIEPATVLSAIAVFVIGLMLLRLFKRWLGESLLPTTHMDAGMRESVVTLLGYLGGVLVFALALAALNVSLQSIAWIASALSVGIGFGLQAIVQNFISGLILLVERPVKVGDWVSLSSDVEGDIRRINVRATEIQMWDRSTVIVPNSQLITQNVRNVTLANAQGRVQIKLPMPLDTPAGKVRGLVLGILRAHRDTLSAPAPYAQLENVATGVMTFNCVAYVGSPREVSGVKSELLFQILESLRSEGLPMTSPQSMLVRTLPPLPEEDENTG